MSQPLRLGPYRLATTLGSGANGTVWRATHAPSGREVAVKVLLPDRDRRSLEREVRAMAALDHPNVLVVHDHGTVELAGDDPSPVVGVPYVVTELAAGDLRSLRPDHDDVGGVLAEVLDGLAHAHARGLVHRDLKPENLLRVGERWKLADFGLAWRATEGGPRTAGSPAYMAPEQLRGEVDRLGPWTDLYAVGCLAWELLTGRLPFERATTDELVAAHLNEEPKLEAELPEDWIDWVRGLLRKDPARRPQLAADARERLRQLGSGTVSLAGPVVTRRSSGRTLDLERLDAPDAPEPEGAIAAGGPPPFDPEGWRPQTVDEPIPRHGAEIGLLGLRRLRLAGRSGVCQRAWEALATVHATGRAHGLRIDAEPGLGRSAVLAWLGETAHERGAAHVAWRTPDRSDPMPEVHELEQADRPTVLLVDDADRDPAARAVAARLLAARGAERVPVLVVLSVGAMALRADQALEDEIDRLVPPEDRVVLEPLPPDAAEELLRQLIRVDDDEALRDLVAAGDGNPAWLVRSADRWAHGEAEPRPAADPRLEALVREHGVAATVALEVLAAADRPLDRALWRLAGGAVEALVADAHEAGLIRGDPPDLASPGLRAALLGSAADTGRLAGHHSALADAAEARPPVADYDLGRHRLLAGRPDLAVPLLGRAAAGADRALEACRLLASALEARGEPAGSPEWLHHHFHAARALFFRGAHTAAAPLLEEAIGWARAHQNANAVLSLEAQRASIELARGRIHPWFVTLRAGELATADRRVRYAWIRTLGYSRERAAGRREIARWLAEGPEPAVEVLLGWEDAVLATFDGDLASARASLRRACDLDELDHPGNAAHVLVYRAWVEAQAGNWSGMRTLASEAAEVARRTGNVHGLRNALVLLAEATAGLGNLPRSLEGLDACERMDRVLGISPAETLMARGRVLLGAERIPELGAMLGRIAPCADDDARADLRGAWLALALALPSHTATLRIRFASELDRGGVRTPQIASVIEHAAALASDPVEARALGGIVERLRRP